MESLNLDELCEPASEGEKNRFQQIELSVFTVTTPHLPEMDGGLCPWTAISWFNAAEPSFLPSPPATLSAMREAPWVFAVHLPFVVCFLSPIHGPGFLTLPLAKRKYATSKYRTVHATVPQGHSAGSTCLRILMHAWLYDLV